MSERIPRSVRTFIRRHVHSVGELDLLLLLQDGGDRLWRAEDVVDALGAPRAWVTRRLEAMETAGLVVRDAGGWRYRPRTPALRDSIRALAATHAARRRDVVSYVFSTRRVR